MAVHPKILIVGAGPGGISLAIELIELGCKRDDILILEKADVPIDAIRKFYPDKKMTIANYKNLSTETLGHLPSFPDLTKAETLVYFDELIKKYDLSIRYRCEVTKITDTTSGGYSVLAGQEWLNAPVVAIGIGILGRPNKPDYKIPSPIKDKILFDLTSKPVSNQNVLVVGGGDTSSEYCQSLVQDNNQVSICYRGEQFTRMLDQNVKALKDLETQAKVKILLRHSITGLEDVNGKVKVVFESGESLFFDTVVYAIGGTTPTNFLKSAGIEFSNDWPRLSPSGETSKENLFLLGDLAVGKQGGSIITAYNASFKTAQEIKLRLN